MQIFPELDLIEKVTHRLSRLGVSFERHTLAQIDYKGRDFPVYGFVIGSKDPAAPTFGLFGGVHGLEKVGTHVILNYLNSLAFRYSLNDFIKSKLENVRIVSIPMVNPVGVHFNKRGNGNGVDLMRNAPTEAVGQTIPMASGHRISPKIWWYRGQKGILEKEARTLVSFVEEYMFRSELSMALDVHSGFGKKDRLWYPYGKTTDPFPLIQRARSFRRLMKLINPFHVYTVEGQSDSYLIHGDLWDYMFDLQYENPNYSGEFLPWTLEMGSWNWVKKNPLQLIYAVGMFHPMKPHRVKRTMRRHWWLLDFFTNYMANGGELVKP